MEHAKERAGKLLPMAVFLAMLIFFGIWLSAEPDRSYSVSERRLLAQKPKLTAETVWSASYMTDYETYLTDQFPMRDQWITVKTYCSMLLGQRESGGVYIARDHSLIELHAPDFLNEEVALRNEEALLTFVKDMYGYGAEHVSVMLVPTAESVWKDKLSAYAQVFDQRAYQERLRGLLMERGAGQSCVDVWEMLAEHRQEPVYYKTDHHWTVLGAYYGYLEYVRKLAGEDGALPGSGGQDGIAQGSGGQDGGAPYQDAAERYLMANGLPVWEDYELETVRSDFHGTTAAKCGLYHIRDEITLVRPKEYFAEQYQVAYDLGAARTDSLYSYEQAAGDDPYSVYLDGNHAVTEITVTRGGARQSGRSLLLVKDSYANSIVPYLTAVYDEITVIDLRYYNAGIHALMEERGYTDVLVLYNLPNFLTERTVYKLGK